MPPHRPRPKAGHQGVGIHGVLPSLAGLVGVAAGLLLFSVLPSLTSAGVVDDLADEIGFDPTVLGGILGMALLFGAIIIISQFHPHPAVYILIALGVTVLNVLLELWDSWVILMFAVLGGLLAWQAIASA